VQGQFRMELTTSDQVGVEYTDAFEHLDAPFAVAPGVTIPPGDYQFGQVRATWMMSASRRMSGFASVTAGQFYGGTLRELAWRGRVELSPQWSIEPQLSLNHVDTPYGVGDTNVLGARATFTLTPRMFVSALMQYQSSVKAVTNNLRFRWEYQPGSELFIVYSDARDTDNTGFPPPILNRSFVVKVTKLFRLGPPAACRSRSVEVQARECGRIGAPQMSLKELSRPGRDEDGGADPAGKHAGRWRQELMTL
jgi:hypothetical protein